MRAARIRNVIIIVVVGIVGACAWYGWTFYNIITDQYAESLTSFREYDQQLTDLGIEPTLDGMEAYLVRELRVGANLPKVFAQLDAIAIVGITMDPAGTGCSTIGFTPRHVPGGRPPLFGIETIIQYKMDVCTQDGIIITTGELIGPIYL